MVIPLRLSKGGSIHIYIIDKNIQNIAWPHRSSDVLPSRGGSAVDEVGVHELCVVDGIPQLIQTHLYI